ncbi:hypothetical protein CRG98_031902 [Punica granatum]|nr:hypothetical protein CRG98_031902 [Punica granatum]
MSWDYDYSVPSEYAAAVAASAFAVHSLKVEAENQRKVRVDFEASRDKTKSKTIDVKPGVSRRSSNKEAEASARRPQESAYHRPPRTGSRAAATQKRTGYANRAEDKGDAWERAQMEKIRKRHDRTKSSILEWENQKKSRAKLFMERKKAEMEQRKAKNNEHYRIKIARIERIAGEARAQAEERRRNEESKAREKAKKIRSGEASVGCFCF